MGRVGGKEALGLASTPSVSKKLGLLSWDESAVDSMASNKYRGFPAQEQKAYFSLTAYAGNGIV